MILSMHARMAECVDTQDERGVVEARKPVPMPAASLGNCRSAGLRTLELKRPGRFGASPSRALRLSGSWCAWVRLPLRGQCWIWPLGDTSFP